MSPQLLVADLDRAIEFYTSMLSFELEFRYENFYAGIMKGNNSIHLKSAQRTEEQLANKLENQDLDIVFGVENVKLLYDDLVSKSVNITQPLCERPYGNEFYIADPDGNVLAFLE